MSPVTNSVIDVKTFVRIGRASSAERYDRQSLAGEASRIVAMFMAGCKYESIDLASVDLDLDLA
jgi:hypothetical protein